MDELPPHVKKIIAEARRAHAPPDVVRRKIWLRLQAAVVVPIRPHQPAMGRVSKLAVAAGVIAALGSISYLLRTETQRSHTTARTLPSSAPTAEHQPGLIVVATPQEGIAPRAPPSSEQSEREIVHPAQQSRGADAARDHSLRAEMSLLSGVSDSLAHHDLEKAKEMLELYRVRHPRGQLHEEYAGLEILRRCLLAEPEARALARTYLRTAPRGLLRTRIQHACKLHPES